MLNASSARRQDRSACGLSFSSALSSAWRAVTHAVVAGDAWSETFSSAWVSRIRARPLAPLALGM
jgi:hypothetical protein